MRAHLDGVPWPLACPWAMDPDWSQTDETYLAVYCAYCGQGFVWGRN